MTSKEALKDISYLILQEVDNLKYKNLWKEALNTIKQDLERLEAFEKENKSVRFNNIQVCTRNKKYSECIKKILEYAKCELDSIEIVDRIENILKEVLG